MSEKIKLILADDHVLIREGFKALLGKNENFDVIGEASDGKELMRLLEVNPPDVILVDITMPEMNGLEAIAAIRKEDSYVKIIVLTMHEEREYVLKAIKYGANGFLLKNVEKQELETAIKSVYEGGKYFSPFVINILADSISKPEPEELPDITPREKEVLELVAKGMSTKQIADQLSISIRTVESHRINMLKKMKVNNSAELIRKAIEFKILQS
jgi:DNA-binding NarL/FixJ family response regulator